MFNAINFDFAPEITDGVSHPMNVDRQPRGRQRLPLPVRREGGPAEHVQLPRIVRDDHQRQLSPDGRVHRPVYRRAVLSDLDLLGRHVPRTVAFSEALVGDGMGYGRIGHNITDPSRYRGNVFMSATVSAPPGSRRVDAFQDKAAVLAGLEACATAFRTTNYIADHRGWRWGQGVTGFSMFNTILTPNDHQYQLRRLPVQRHARLEHG